MISSQRHCVPHRPDLIALLIDEPQLPRAARDALLVVWLADDPEVVTSAKRRAAEILRRAFGLSPTDLAELLGLELAFAG